MANWDKISARGNVIDLRGSKGPMFGGLGIVGFGLVAAFTLLTGGDPTQLVNIAFQEISNTRAPSQSAQDLQSFEGLDDYEVFASTVLGSINQTWSSIFSQSSQTYTEPTLKLFRESTTSACGGARTEIGPHYCPADQTIYLDERFFDELTSRLGAQGGDVAEAYVIAHEVGHHVQNLLGTSDQIRPGDNEGSVKLELQADCYAGVWANSIRDLGVFEVNEINEALDAAAAVGDDRIQEQSSGRVNPETWTHGSSEQRVDWFNRGFNSGQPGQCDTFAS